MHCFTTGGGNIRRRASVVAIRSRNYYSPVLVLIGGFVTTMGLLRSIKNIHEPPAVIFSAGSHIESANWTYSIGSRWKVQRTARNRPLPKDAIFTSNPVFKYRRSRD
jgi:hypothetical protein